MRTSQAGIRFIKGWESFRAIPYRDEGGIWSLGYGSTRDAGGEAISEKTPPIEEDDAERLLARDLETAEYTVNRIGIFLTQNQFDALVSLCYNIGCGAFDQSTVRKCVTCRTDPTKAFEQWHLVHGLPSEGLERRRIAEAALYRSPD